MKKESNPMPSKGIKRPAPPPGPSDPRVIKAGDLAYRLARQILNPDGLLPHTVALTKAILLSDLKKLDPKRYKEAVKPTTPYLADIGLD